MNNLSQLEAELARLNAMFDEHTEPTALQLAYMDELREDIAKLKDAQGVKRGTPGNW